jgi:hypothetical protein
MRMSYDSTGVDVNGPSSVPAPAANYTLEIKQVFDTDKEGNPRRTKNGDPMVSARCEIADANEWLGTTVWHNITFLPKEKKGAGMAVAFLKAIGEPWEGAFEIDTDNWKDKTFRAKLKVVTGLNGQPRNEVAYLLSDETKDEDVPF